MILENDNDLDFRGHLWNQRLVIMVVSISTIKAMKPLDLLEHEYKLKTNERDLLPSSYPKIISCEGIWGVRHSFQRGGSGVRTALAPPNTNRYPAGNSRGPTGP